ncbi:MAG: SPASM domain-containing protein [Candidatus Saccharicenans sp.]
MKKSDIAADLPFRPEPFVFRLELNPNALRDAPFIEKILASASIIQLEAVGPFTEESLKLLQFLDNHQSSFCLRLLVRSDDHVISEYLDPLSRLKKLVAFMIIAPAEKTSVARLNELLFAAASSSLKPGVLIELDPAVSSSELKDFIRKLRQAGALEIALRPSPALISRSYDAGSEFYLFDSLNELKSSGLPVSLEECFSAGPAISGVEPNPGSDHFEFNCRRGSGSCYINYKGEVKICRRLDRVIGNLSSQSPECIWEKILFDQNICPHLKIPLSRNEFSADNCTPANEIINKFPDENKATLKSARTAPVNLDSSLRPVPLYTFKEKSWGALLIKSLDGVILSHRGAEIALLIDGEKTLGHLRKKYGSRAVQFVLALFLKGFVRLEK